MRQFAWDANKNESNRRKHGIDFALAVRAFLDPRLVDIDASRESDGETRRKAIGMIGAQRYAIVYTTRGDTIRIISARRTNRTEDRLYGDRVLSS